MAKKDEIVGKALDEFLSWFPKEKYTSNRSEGDSSKRGFHIRPAKLLPTVKPGEELALTAVFLAAIKYIPEFRKQICTALGLTKTGKVHVFTEVSFPQLDKLKGKSADRIDGLLIIEKSGIIEDAAFFESKQKANELDKKQLEEYLEIAKKHRVPRLVTISNQFVPNPNQMPLSLKVPKDVSTNHLSWTYILTVARILLFDNDINIENDAQKALMQEIVDYFEHDVSGVLGFKQMKPGWKATTEKIARGANLKKDDSELIEAAESWVQEESDLALVLSRELGLMVKTSASRGTQTYEQRVQRAIENAINGGFFESELFVDDAVSKIEVRVPLDRRTVEMRVSLSAPETKTLKGQFGWLRRQLDQCARKSPEKWKDIEPELFVETNLKHQRVPEQVALKGIDTFTESNKGHVAKTFNVLQIRQLGRDFESRKKFVDTIEDMLKEYYGGVVQYLKNWDKPAPKMPSYSEPEPNDASVIIQGDS